MKYKVLIVKNNFKKKYNFEKGKNWFSKFTPIKLDITEMETSIPLTFEKVSNSTLGKKNTIYAVDDKVKEILQTIIPRNSYHCVCLLYGDKAPGIRVSTADKNPLHEETDFIEVVKLDNGETFNHELIHTFFNKLKRMGINIGDPMDSVVINSKVYPYYNNNSLDAKKSNRTIALDKLAPYWDKIVTFNNEPEVIIKREPSSKNQTLGKLTAKLNGATFTCDTLELAWKDNQSNVSCIPKGDYDVKMTFSPRFLKYTYEITNVPNRTSIRIHSGNLYSQINGCVLLGMSRQDINKDGELDVLNSKATILSFEGFMQKSPFKLRII